MSWIHFKVQLFFSFLTKTGLYLGTESPKWFEVFELLFASRSSLVICTLFVFYFMHIVSVSCNLKHKSIFEFVFSKHIRTHPRKEGVVSTGTVLVLVLVLILKQQISSRGLAS